MCTATKKTGTGNRPWVVLDSPKPPKVDDRYQYWATPPQHLSQRCTYWLEQAQRGWRPNRHISSMGYDEAAGWFGVYIWEYVHLLRRACDAQ